MRKVLGLLCGIGLMLCGCRSSVVVSALGLELAPALEQPTAAAPFGVTLTDNAQPETATPFRPEFGAMETPAALDRQPRPTVTATPNPLPTTVTAGYVEVMVFDDEVAPNWSLEKSSDLFYEPFDTSHWFSQLDGRTGLDSGAVSIAVTPLADFGKLFFTVKPGANATYEREKVAAISMWINSGSTILDTDDLAVAVIGSNNLPYWSPDDFSVFPDGNQSFSETRLYYLGLNRAIPPDTWAQIIVWLDDREFDPLYSHVVGFYIKNDAGFDTTFYVDRVSLLLIP